MFKKKIKKSHFVPSGLMAKTEKGFFYVKNDKRFKVISDRALKTWKLQIVHTTEQYMKNVKIVGIVGFRDGSLIKDISNNKVYFISNNQKLHITSPDVIKLLGYKKDDIILVSAKEAAVHKEGVPLNG